jgi:hypothetical protein
VGGRNAVAEQVSTLASERFSASYELWLSRHECGSFSAIVGAIVG